MIYHKHYNSSLSKDLNFYPNNNYNTFDDKLNGAITKHTSMK